MNKIFYLIFISSILTTSSFSAISPILGKWKTNNNKAIFIVNNQNIIVNNIIKMNSTLDKQFDNYFFIKLTDLQIIQVPNHFAINEAITAIKYINHFKKHGINILVNYQDNSVNVSWDSYNKFGNFTLYKCLE